MSSATDSYDYVPVAIVVQSDTTARVHDPTLVHTQIKLNDPNVIYFLEMVCATFNREGSASIQMMVLLNSSW